MPKCGICKKETEKEKLTAINCDRLRNQIKQSEIDAWPKPLRERKRMKICDNCFSDLELNYALSYQLYCSMIKGRKETLTLQKM